MSTDKEYIDWHNKCLRECPEWIVEQSVEFLRKAIPDDIKEKILEEYKQLGVHWVASYHFSWGMFIRNQLRDNVCTDETLPTKNWDDLYVQLVEIVVGIRNDISFEEYNKPLFPEEY